MFVLALGIGFIAGVVWWFVVGFYVILCDGWLVCLCFVFIMVCWYGLVGFVGLMGNLCNC